MSIIQRPLLVLFVLASALVSSSACGNSPGEKITIVENGRQMNLRCRKVYQNKSYCRLTDVRSGKPVKKICRDQCRKRCQKIGGTFPTAAPATPTPLSAPTLSPPSIATSASITTTQPPTGISTRIAVLGPIPAGPYFTSTTNSKVITLPNPATPSLIVGGARTNCPHLQSGLRSWHDTSLWPGGVLPTAGASVTLPINMKVVVQRNITEKLGIITIPSTSELIIGEATGGVSMLVKGMDVQGKLTAGSETCRIEKPISITLWSPRPSNAVQSVPPPTTKGIYVTGTLSLHGKRYYSTWSRLAKTIQPGETVLLLQRPVNWERGQEVVLTTSSIYDSRAYHRNEVVTVDYVETVANTPAGVGAVVRLQQAVKYKHVANQYYQVEAGLLSRTILIQGSAEDSEPTDMDPLTCKTQGFPSYDFYYNLPAPCTKKETTGYGGHIMIAGVGVSQVSSIELFRMGQTNVLGRYAFHWHMLGNCPSCYLRDSSIHRSFYRCISVHGTNQATVSENVAYDVIGHCYYLEDGVEEDNTISFNLAAHIHTLGPEVVMGSGQQLKEYSQSATLGSELTVPADVTASGFYITNVHNNLIGNAASGGYVGFSFIPLDTPLGLSKNVLLRPRGATGLTIDGNTAHSTGFWWKHATGFYLGGYMYYKSDGTLVYGPGRSSPGRGERLACLVYKDCIGTACKCKEENERSLNITNTKTFLTAGVGFNSWKGLMDMKGFEAYDTRLAIQALSKGFYMDKMYVACRTGESLGLPSPGSASKMEGTGFNWYDTTQSHIITNAVFQNCGFRSDEFNQYDTSPTRGCGSSTIDVDKGCKDTSTVFGFAANSDENVPEVMQATRGLSFLNCGRRFRLTVLNNETIAARHQNWLDIDGSASGLGVPVIIGSGLPSVKDWWGVDNEVLLDSQGPVRFIKKNNGPGRGVGHVAFSWDPALHAQVGSTICLNGEPGPCPRQGYMRHAGYKFSPSRSGASNGLPVMANPSTVGPVGGFGWILKLDGGAPRDLNMTEIELDPSHMMLVSIAYPVGTVFTVSANSVSYCHVTTKVSCRETFTAASSIAALRTGTGNKYFVDSNGVLTVRLFELPRIAMGNPNWLGIPSWNSTASDGINKAVPRFERSGIILPNFSVGNFRVQAQCGGTGVFCSGTPSNYDPNVCQSGYQQVAYDKCCSTTNPSQCTFADGTTSS